jgi:predicted hydrocarbon binding protein/predicted regulator of Ras-like GTPase activity (Roadblock/LC7/MglB family)
LERIKLLYDPRNGNMFFDKISSTLDNRDNEGIFQRELESIVGPVTRPIMYNAAKSLTRNNTRSYYRGMLEKGLDQKAMLRDVMDFLHKRGLGVFEGTLGPGKRFTVRVRNSFNAMGYERTEKPICYVLSGILAGILEPIVKATLECRETRCLAMGHGFCEFELRPAAKNEFPRNYFRAEPLKEVRGLKAIEAGFDREGGELVFEGTSAQVNFREHDALYQREFEKIIGPAVRSIMYYYIGKYPALESMNLSKKLIVKIIGTISVKPLANEFAKKIPERGYGLLEDLSIDDKNKEITFRIKNCYNAMGYRNSREPVCYAFAGVAAGSTSLLFNEESECIETRCMGMGAPRCEFKTFVRKENRELQDILKELNQTPGIRGSIVFLKNGIIRGFNLPGGISLNEIAARFGILAGIGENASKHLGIGTMSKLFLNSTNGMIIATNLGQDVFLATLVKHGANIGVVELGMDKAAKKIVAVL